MAPPVKRRKLSGSTAEHIYEGDDTALDGVSAYAHAVDALHHHRHRDPSRIGNHAVEEVRVQEVKQAAWNEDAKVLYPRQETSVVPDVPAIPTFGVQTFTADGTTIIYTPPATPLLPTLPVVPGATTIPTSYPSGYTTDTPATTSSIPSSVSIPSSNATISLSSSASSSSSSSITTSAAIFRSNGTVTTSSTTMTPTGAVFFATLGNGDVSTITRANSVYTTAFGDSTFTVSAYDSSTTRSSTDQPESDTFSPGRSTVMDVTAAGGQTFGTPTATAPPSSSTTAASESDDGGEHSDPPPAGTIAGGVVGGAAGLAVLVLVALLFLRWYRRRGQIRHQALPATSISSPDLSRDGAPGMAERAGMIPFAAAVPALFRHGNKGEPLESSERGFTRISGRKLPSQWSEGMSSTAPPPNMPLTAQASGEEFHRNLSNASPFRDSQAFYGGEGATSPFGVSPSSDGQGPLRTSGGEITMSPGPERHPTFHSGGPYHVPQPGSAFGGGGGRSETPISDPARSSRFTEDM